MNPIDISNQKNNFDYFLGKDNNERIIFSGIFGIGKTYFLNDFFLNHEKYVPINLYPTNYSVAKNEDIFELIKYDILYEILYHKPHLEKLSINNFEALEFVANQDIYKLFKAFIEVIPIIGKRTLSIIDPLEDLVKVLQKVKLELSNNEGKHIEEFAKEIQVDKGSIYEDDFYTQLIVKLIRNVKLKSNKEIVLVVDDLDRIDPDHIFRILNIFAAHFDIAVREGGKNKFDIDKVILCCDINNIRNIFKNRYGTDVDFNGYIDKFYTSEIYHFNNKKLVSDTIGDFIASIEILNTDRAVVEGYSYFFNAILSSMLYSNTLSLRTLKNWYKRKLEIDDSVFVLHYNGLTNQKIGVIQMFQLLSKFFGGRSHLFEVLEKTNFGPLVNWTNSIRPLGDLILLSDFANHRFKPDVALNYTLNSATYSYVVKTYQVGYDEKYYADVNRIQYNGEEIVKADLKIHFKDLLLKAYKNYLDGLLEPKN